MKPRLHTVIASTRPGRLGGTIGEWFHGRAQDHGAFDARLVDLADFDLPVYDEPRHPMLQQYEHDHTRRWSDSVAAADAFVFVMPEYNFGPPPSLLNALDFLYREWNYKPAGFVSYGGVSGGMRGVQALKPTLTTLKMVPVVEQVVMPMVFDQVHDGILAANDLQVRGASDMLDELKRWTDATKAMRGSAAMESAA